jgi:hypothetical protein
MQNILLKIHIFIYIKIQKYTKKSIQIYYITKTVTIYYNIHITKYVIINQ